MPGCEWRNGAGKDTADDARGIVVALTDAETAPVHLRGVSELFVAQLDDQELAILKNALDQGHRDCTFG